MSHQRNVEGLRESARRRHQETLARAERAIGELSQANRPITFPSVSQAAGVSISWLYKQPEIRERIQHLRDQQRKRRGAQPAQILRSDATDASRDAIIAALKEQIKELLHVIYDWFRFLFDFLGKNRGLVEIMVVVMPCAHKNQVRSGVVLHPLFKGVQGLAAIKSGARGIYDVPPEVWIRFFQQPPKLIRIGKPLRCALAVSVAVTDTENLETPFFWGVLIIFQVYDWGWQ